MKNQKIFYKKYKFSIFYFKKLNIFFYKLLSTKDLIIYKFRKKKALIHFYYFFLYLIIKKKRNSVYYYMQTQITGIKNVVNSNYKYKKKYFKNLNYCYDNAFDKGVKIKLRIPIEKKSDICESIFTNKTLISIKKLKMSQCFYIFVRKKYEKLKKKEKKKTFI